MLHLLFDRSTWFLNSARDSILHPGLAGNRDQIISNIVQSLVVVEKEAMETGTLISGDGDSTGNEGDFGDSEKILQILSSSAPENESVLTFPVLLSESAEDTVYVDYDSKGVSATSGLDFLSVSGTLVIEPGITESEIHVWIMEDEKKEPEEKFTVTLSNALNAGIDKRSGKAIGTIVDND